MEEGGLFRGELAGVNGVDDSLEDWVSLIVGAWLVATQEGGREGRVTHTHREREIWIVAV